MDFYVIASATMLLVFVIALGIDKIAPVRTKADEGDESNPED